MSDVLGRLRAALADRYRIERELGAGGMATVYLARDLRHERAVALKVLRPELAAALGPERFLREIKTTAQLNHPHILPLLDSGAADGTLFYVMPYVEGESLRGRLEREKQLPLDDALQIVREVADALSYAHSQGVIHRDIKPENILLQGGHAVVADFGIARAVSAAGGTRLTETGLAIGTPAYMSPEQATGSEDVDGRSDLYSLGCVLYEMLSGETPYTGPTAQAILAKKLSEPLPRISVVREAVSPGIEAALAKALARTPADRWVTASDFAAALAHPDGFATPSGGTAPAATRRPRVLGRLPRWARWAAGVAALAVVALLVSQFLKPKPINITVSDVTPVTSEAGVAFEPAISPDGQEVAYVAGSIDLPRLFVRSTVNRAGEAAIRLGDTAPGSEWLPIWSPDGQSIRFVDCGPGGFNPRSRCEVKEVGKLGGAARQVAVRGRWTWSPDGTHIAFNRGDTIFTSTATGTLEHRVVALRPRNMGDAHSLAWSPDGRWIAFVVGNSLWRIGANSDMSAIVVVDAAGGEPWPVAPYGALNVSPAWLDANHLLFVSNRDGPRAVYVVEVGAHGSRGAPRAVPGIADPHSISYSASARRLAFARFSNRQNIWAYPLDRSSPASIRDGRPVTTGAQGIEEHDVSPDGKWIAYDAGLRGKMDLYKIPAAGGEAVTLANFPGGEAFEPRWSPDGREIAFWGVVTDTGNRISVVPAEGGSPTALTQERGFIADEAWSPDGLTISFISAIPGGYRTWVLSRDSVGAPWHERRILVDSAYVAAWAPDGSGALITGDPDLPNSTFDFVSPQGRKLWHRDLAAMYGLTLSGGRPRYSPDGRTIYAAAAHRDGRRGVWAIPARGGSPRLVVAFDDPALANPYGFLSVGPDRLYLTVAEYESDIWVAKLSW